MKRRKKEKSTRKKNEKRPSNEGKGKEGIKEDKKKPRK